MEPPALSVANGHTTVPAPGTRVNLPDQPARSVLIKALHANTKLVYVGGAAVAAANGVDLPADIAIPVDVDNLNLIWIDADVANEGVSWLAVQ